MALNFHLPTKVFLNIDDFKPKPPDCICAGFPFIYNPVGYAITDDLNIINLSTRCVRQKDDIYRETKAINWKHNFKILLDSTKDYARP